MTEHEPYRREFVLVAPEDMRFMLDTLRDDTLPARVQWLIVGGLFAVVALGWLALLLLA
jgi:hypothetical protein